MAAAMAPIASQEKKCLCAKLEEDSQYKVAVLPAIIVLWWVVVPKYGR
jgi:hypothetical protein